MTRSSVFAATMFATGALICLLSIAAPAAADTVSPPPIGPTGTVEANERNAGAIKFSVLGDVGAGAGSYVTAKELLDLGVEMGRGDLSGGWIAVRGARAEPTAATNNVLFRWNDFAGRAVVLRSQPYKKILTKHNLTYRSPRAVTRYASTRTHDGGQAWRYRVKANEVQCDFWGNNCKVKRSVWVRTIVDFRAYQGDSYGVVTAYCEGHDGKCPDFVKNALNQ